MPFPSIFQRFKKQLSGILILAIFLPYIYLTFPEKAEAGGWPTWDIIGDTLKGVTTPGEMASGIANPVTAGATTLNAGLSTADHIKKFILDPLAMMMAKMIIQEITASTVKWINTGFNGNPAYISDPASFFQSIGDQTAGYYLSKNSWIVKNLCSPFQAKINLALTQSYLRQTSTYSCTLGKIEQNFDAFTNDFTQGGWEGWFSMTQSQSNNPFGAYIQAQDALSKQVVTATAKYQTQLNQSNGFLSFERCKKGAPSLSAALNGTGKPVCSGYALDGKTCLSWIQGAPAPSAGPTDSIPTPTSGGDCLGSDKETVTPGSVIQQQLSKTLGSTIDQLGVAQSINQIVGALMVQMVKRVTGAAASGLRGLSESSSGSPSLQSQIGNTGNAGSLSIPQMTVPQETQSGINDTEQTITGQSLGAVTKATDPANAPSITLIGEGGNSSNPLVWPVGQTWQDPGFTAADPVDGDITSNVKISGNVDVNTTGYYSIKYSVTNSQGMSATPVIRVVSIGDNSSSALLPFGQSTGTTPSPSVGNVAISFTGANPMNWPLGQTWQDPGAVAVNSNAIVVPTNKPNVDAVGTYLVKYNAFDSTGAIVGTATRTVNVN